MHTKFKWNIWDRNNILNKYLPVSNCLILFYIFYSKPFYLSPLVNPLFLTLWPSFEKYRELLSQKFLDMYCDQFCDFSLILTSLYQGYCHLWLSTLRLMRGNILSALGQHVGYHFSIISKSYFVTECPLPRSI